MPDEVALGVTYEEIDDYLEGREVSEKAAERIEELWTKSEHKRHLPVTIFDDYYKKIGADLVKKLVSSANFCYINHVIRE